MKRRKRGRLFALMASVCGVVWACSDRPEAPVAESASKSILFDMRRDGADGPDEIYSLDPDTLEPAQLTRTPEPFGSGYPRWSPDRSQIAFISNRGGDEDIWVMDENGGNARRLVHMPGDDWSPSWTPDGTKIAFISDTTEGRTAYLINADGTDLSPLGDRVGDLSGDLHWSADARRLLFTSGRAGDGQARRAAPTRVGRRTRTTSYSRPIAKDCGTSSAWTWTAQKSAA